MTALGRGMKAAQKRDLAVAKAGLKGLGASEMGNVTAREARTASTRAVSRSHNAGVRVRRMRMRRIRLRG